VHRRSAHDRGDGRDGEHGGGDQLTLFHVGDWYGWVMTKRPAPMIFEVQS
jgi:hypothetical protein